MFFSLKSNKMLFLFILFISTLISISANSWFGCWIGLEINLLSFIPLISNSKNLLSNEASLKYFLTQSIASINFLFLILMKLTFFNLLSNNILSLMMNLPLLMKMGSAPFHFWFPNIIEGLSWINNFILMSWQKISPMILLTYFFNKNFLILILIFNSIIGAIGGLNQTSLRKIMAFSSINNMSWMISSMLISENLWLFYFMFYSFLIMIMCLLFNNFNMYFINQLYILNMNSSLKFSFLINFLSLGGLPPFIGFFSKWIVINFLMMNNFIIISFIFIMMSLIMLFYYIRISYSSLMFNYLKLKWFKLFFKNKNNNLINLMTMISITGMIFSSMFFL
uniref:NADH-ubiquinone oxidoreductase chain 2 n=1 Tax=Parasa consocia TaxID=1481755 RepID=A0A1X9IRG3_PARCO|nr:NADH dehydrogenase subunit 2 [Parasa consocia]APH08556.1 NADH dehydrogenase subunit 2 [Parasa consocia]UMR54991.1 NADH dehydrogenase subunit 2 [Parasa consocia]